MSRSAAIPLLILLILFTSAAGPLFAERRIALVDFAVHSDNPRYSYLGKGIGEMIAVELSKSPEVSLVEREERVELMKEVKFALSGLAEDSEKQVQVGRMLSADYLVFGEIVDMAPQLLISIRVTEVESGEVVFREKLAERPGRYEYISGYFASSILDHFEVKVAESTEKKTEEKREKDEEAVVAFSRAIEAYDRDEKEEAKKELEKAKRIDPGYEAAKVYLRKLESISPKFRVETDYYAPTINPAYLAMMDGDMMYVWSGFAIYPPEADADGFQEVDEYLLKEYFMTQRIGYSFPLGKRWGIAIDYTADSMNNWVFPSFPFEFEGELLNTPGNKDEIKNSYGNQGVIISTGYLIHDSLGVGASMRTDYEWTDSGGTTNAAEEDLNYGAGGGLLYSISGGKYLLDLQLSYYTQEDWYFDEDDKEFKSGALPLIVDGSFVASYLDNRLVTALKGIGDVYIDARGGYALRAIPIAEYWILPYLSLRGGYEYVHLDQAGSFTIGSGFLAGFSLKLGNFTLHSNYTLRKKPSRQVPGRLISESYVMLGLTYTPGWITRN